jgi:hypothetical protein
MIGLAPYAFGVVLTLVVAAFQLLAPRLSRGEIFFSVTVHPQFRGSEAGVRIERSYRRQILLHAAIALLLDITLVSLLGLFAALSGLAWQWGGWFAAFFLARRKVLPHAMEPTAVREASLAARRRDMPGGRLLIMGPFAILAVTGCYHCWTGPTSFARWSLLMTAAVACAMFLAAASALARGRRIRASGPDAVPEEGARRTMVFGLIGFAYATAWIMSLLVTLLPLRTWPQLMTFLVLAIVPTGAFWLVLNIFVARYMSLRLAALREERPHPGSRSGPSATALPTPRGSLALSTSTVTILRSSWKAGLGPDGQ